MGERTSESASRRRARLSAVSASPERARAAATSVGETSERFRFSSPAISNSLCCALSRAASASCCVAACCGTRRSRLASVFCACARSNRARARLFSMSVNSAGLPPASWEARLARASFSLAWAASISACSEGSAIEASTAPAATVCPSSTGARLTTPPVSARTACQTEGSTLPLVGSVLTSVCRFTRAKLTFGGSLLRSTPHTMTAATPASSAHSSSFFKS